MLAIDSLTSRKRRNPEGCTFQQNTCSKKQKSTHLSGSQFPPTFWDNLSKIDLTKRALEELNRRNTHEKSHFKPPTSQSHRPITRQTHAKKKKGRSALQSAETFLLHCGTKGLKTIKQSAKRGGPDLSDLKGFPEPLNPLGKAMSSSQSSSRIPRQSSRSTSITKPSRSTTTGPYNPNFEQNLIDYGVYPEGYEYPDGRVPPLPDNWEELNERLITPRPSLSPSTFSDEHFRKFKRANAQASKEQQIVKSVIPIIEGDIDDAKCVSGGIRLTNLEPLTDGTLVSGNPDIYHGARPEQLNRQIRDELSGYIVPSTQKDLPVAPNFSMAAKGPGGSGAVAKLQACYDGSLQARGICSLQSHGEDNTFYDHNAYTISCMYNDGQLKMFTNHPASPTGPNGRPEYYMHQLKAWAMTSDPTTFRQGATAYRNARDWTTEKRNQIIDQANARAAKHYNETIDATEGVKPTPSRTSQISTEERFGLSQKSPNLEGSSNTTIDLQDSDNSSCELSSDRLPIKRSIKPLRKLNRALKKRREISRSDYYLSEQSELETSRHSGLSQQLQGQKLDLGLDRESSSDDLQLISLDVAEKPKRRVPKANK